MWTAMRFTLLTFVLSGLIYPLAMTGLAQVFFPEQANGSLLKSSNNEVIGSTLVGQVFTHAEYFHSRPSANNYDAANSGGYNQGATNRNLIERVQKESRTYQQQNPASRGIPIDAVTASGSGLDPHISLANAMQQAPRVARARKLSPQVVQQLVLLHQERSFLTETPYVNVLRMNLALDQQAPLRR